MMVQEQQRIAEVLSQLGLAPEVIETITGAREIKQKNSEIGT